jgi:tRNA A-37 threonylcarbamoyl transferase component Bud32
MSAALSFSDAVFRVLDLPPADRPAALREVAQDHPEWIAMIEQVVSGWDRRISTASLTAGVAAAQHALAPGSHVGQYTIEREIARGGMGVVYAAHDAALDMPVAIKALRPELAYDDRQLERLRTEARILARLSTSPHIARVHAFIEQDGAGFIVQEFVKGETLRARLGRGPLAFAEALEVATAVLDALAAAHRAGIVHRDLKPENVMCTAEGVYKVLDFGIAIPTPEATITRSPSRLDMAGTTRYMSPEQLLGHPVDARSDLFAFGVVMYELLTGRHPFDRHGEPASWSAILVESPAPLSEFEAARVPPVVLDVLMRCMRQRPQDRWTAAGDVQRALHSAVQSSPVIASPSRTSAIAWWQFHQIAAAVIGWLLLVPVWRVRDWIALFEWRVVFFVLLAALSVGPSLRLSLWFVSATHPHRLRAHAARCAPWVRAADIVIALCLVAVGAALAADHPGWATLFVAFGIGSFVVAGFVEPLTAQAAFESLDEQRDRAT